MRGKVAQIRYIRLVQGITPAYAGKSDFLFFDCTLRADHPRLCGEKFSAPFTCPCFLGSPPPMRGKVREDAHGLWGRRITPAYAGKRRRCFPCHKAKEDHPRLCGEKEYKPDSLMTVTGSPPPMRGKAAIAPTSKRDIRITPAYAGKRSFRRSAMHRKQDHPRLCGEK